MATPSITPWFRHLACTLIILAALATATAPAFAQEPLEDAGDGTGDLSDAADGDAGTSATNGNSDLATENATLRARVSELETQVAELTPPPDPPKPNIFGQLRIQLTLASGTKESFGISNNGFITYTDYSEWELTFSAFHTTQISEGETTAAEAFGRFDGKFIGDPVFQPFAFLQSGFNDTREIDFYLDAGAGLEWIYVREPWDPDAYAENPVFMASAILGISYTFESYHPNTATIDSSLVRLLIGAYEEYRANKDVWIRNRTTFEPAFEDFEDFIITNDFTVDIALEDNLGVGILYRFTYDSEPPANVKKAEHYLALTFWWDFKDK